MKRLQNKTALITAAGQGIGLATAKLFIEHGATVIAADINAEALQRVKAEVPAIQTVVLDVTNADQVKAFCDGLAKIDILFNCAGYVHAGTVLECSEEEWDFAHELNVKSMYRLIRGVLPVMVKQQSGSIINMASVASSIKGVPNRFVYSTTKAAVIGLTKAVAVDYVQHGVRCNAICPGTVHTPSLENRMKASGDFEQAKAQFVARQPMGRLGTPDEIANLALYLAGDESSFTTGATHVIDGGWTN
jgi:2-keto-3-deoxy-L-fuconate dehydrogenase